MLIDRDGRVRVVDFGLARADSDPLVSDFSGEHAPELVRDMYTQEAGALTGTPAYMAPEQLRGERATEAADQFSFCVSMWEALYGERPFAGDDIDALQRELASSEQPSAHGRHVPAWVRRVLRRGLSRAPERRYPSMKALLDALAREPGRALRRAVAIGAVVLGVAAAALVYKRALDHEYARALEEERRRCAGAEEKLVGVWDAERGAALERRFAAAGLSYGEDAAGRVGAALDDYARRWAAEHREACEATVVRGEQSQALLDRRVVCLSRVRVELGALVDVLVEADARAIEGAAEAVHGLAPIDRCSAAAVLGQESRDEAPTSPEVDAAHELLARARARAGAGRPREALALAQRAVAVAEALERGPLRAEALILQGTLHAELAELEEARAALWEGLWTAEEFGRYALATLAVAEHVDLTGTLAGEPVTALPWTRYRGLAERRLGAEHVTLARLLLSLARTQLLNDRRDEAEELLTRALAILERARGPSHPALVPALNELARVRRMTGAEGRGLPEATRALGIAEEVFGEHHPQTAVALRNVGNALLYDEQYEPARARYQRGLEIVERAYGPEHPALAGYVSNLGVIAKRLGQLERARELYARALAIAERHHGAEHGALVIPLFNLAGLLTQAGRYADAHGYFERILAIKEGELGAGHPGLTREATDLALNLERMRRASEAAVAWRRVVGMYERKLVDAEARQASARARAELRARLGEARAWSGDPARAQEDCEAARARMVATGEATRGRLLEICDGAVAFARARGGGDDAAAQLEEARRLYRRAEDAAAARKLVVERWRL